MWVIKWKFHLVSPKWSDHARMVIHIWAADEISLHGRQTLPVHSSSFLFIFPLFFPLTPLSFELEIKPLCPHLPPSVSRCVCVCLQRRGWRQNRLLWKQFMFASPLLSQSKVDLTAHPCPGSKTDKSAPSGSNTMEDSPSAGTAFFGLLLASRVNNNPLSRECQHSHLCSKPLLSRSLLRSSLCHGTGEPPGCTVVQDRRSPYHCLPHG